MSEIKLNLEVFLQDLAAREPADIDSDDFDFYGEDDSGNECSCSISIIELAQEAADAIAALKDERDQLAVESAALKAEINKCKPLGYFAIEDASQDDAEVFDCENESEAKHVAGEKGEYWAHGCLPKIPITVSTDAYLAEIRALAVEAIAHKFRIRAMNSMPVAGWMDAAREAESFASDIRAAAKGE